MTQFSKWIPFTGNSCPVDEDRIVEIKTSSGIPDQPPAPAHIFRWDNASPIISYRVEMTADEIAEQEEWDRLFSKSKTG